MWKMFINATRLVSLVFVVLGLASTAHSWGALGHRTVAYLAELYLTSEARSFVGQLLNSQDISEAALWADKIRYIPSFGHTKPWHYIDAQDDPPRQCGLNFTRDCLPTLGCAVSALVNQTSRVNDLSLGHAERGQALRWVLHLIGDIHQPLHTEAEDRGGNGIHVLFNHRHTNLHAVWDTAILEKHAGLPDNMAAAAAWALALYQVDQDPDKGLASECQRLDDTQLCGLVWAGDANKFVCDYVLKDGVEGVEGKDLAYDYFEGAVPIVDRVVAMAGRRLGAWLNALARQDAEREVKKDATEFLRPFGQQDIQVPVGL